MDSSSYASREPSVHTTDMAETESNPANPATNAGTAGPATAPKTPRSRAKFNDPEDLPDENAELTVEQIRQLIYQKPPVRKKYERYFHGRGQIRKELYHLIFERLPTGQLRHPETIIASNVLHWQTTLLHYEKPDKYDAKGREKEPKGKSRASTEEPSKKRKRASSKLSVQQTQSDAPEDSEVGESNAEEDPASTHAGESSKLHAAKSSKTASATCEEAGPNHEMNDSSVTADEAVAPAFPIPTKRASPERTVESPAKDDMDDFKSPSYEPDYNRWVPEPQPESEPARSSVISDLSPPVEGQVQTRSFPTLRRIYDNISFSRDNNYEPMTEEEHNAASTLDPYDEPMTEDQPSHQLHGPTGQAVQIAKDALMAAAASDKSPEQQYLSTDLGRFVSKFEAGHLNLVDADDLSGFTQWINGEIHKLNLKMIQAPVAGKSAEYRHCVNDLMVRLLTLQKACFNLEGELRKDHMIEEE